MRPGIGLCNRRSPRNGSRKYVARRITPSTASEIVVIAATIVTPTKVLVTADAATWSRRREARDACRPDPPLGSKFQPGCASSRLGGNRAYTAWRRWGRVPPVRRSIEEVRGDDPEFSYLRIEERELEAGGLNRLRPRRARRGD
jgi:hypothetical protein